MADIIGTPAPDTLAAGGIGDRVFGRGGRDRLSTVFSDTRLFGENGNDTVAAGIETDGTAIVLLDGGEGDDRLSGEIATTTTTTGRQVLAQAGMAGGNGNDNLDSVVSVADGDDLVKAVTLRNRANGGGGNDRIDVTANVTTTSARVLLTENLVNGGGGDDQIFARADNIDAVASESLARNVVSGGAGNDEVAASAASDFYGNSGNVENVIDGGAGDDVVRANVAGVSNSTEFARNLLTGGEGNDSLTSTILVNTNSGGPVATADLSGGAGNDQLVSENRTGSDIDESSTFIGRLDGGIGTDHLAYSVLSGNLVTTVDARLLGGAGNDRIEVVIDAPNNDEGYGGTFEISADGGSGADTISVVLRASDGGTGSFYSVDLNGGFGRDVIDLDLGADATGQHAVSGGGGNDRIRASGGVDFVLLDGGAGNDTIEGGGAVYELNGGDGDDVLIARGSALAFGAAGADVFVFTLAGPDTTVFTDFDGTEDILAFSGIADQGAAGLADDLAAFTTITPTGSLDYVEVVIATGDATVTITLRAAGRVIDSLDDIVDDAATQIVAADPLLA
jgi:Ca2+-binding RTX toxin-like protein